MPEVSGLDIAKRIREINKNTIIVFISSYEQYVFSAFEYNAFRYLRKELLDQELLPAMRALINELKEREQQVIVLKIAHDFVKVKYPDIMYFETSGRKLCVHLINGKVYEVRKSIKEIQRNLNSSQFAKVHSGCLVNLKYVSSYSKNQIILDNKKTLFISRTKAKDFKYAFMEYNRNRLFNDHA